MFMRAITEEEEEEMCLVGSHWLLLLSSLDPRSGGRVVCVNFYGARCGKRISIYVHAPSGSEGARICCHLHNRREGYFFSHFDRGPKLSWLNCATPPKC